MPGIFGAVGCDSNLQDTLSRHFTAPWGDCTELKLSNGILGGHAFGKSRVVHTLSDNTHFAIDGEKSIYEFEIAPFSLSAGGELSTSCKGNLAIATNDRWYLATDWAGGFPLYYSHTPTGFIFCSRLRPLAEILRPQIDIVGFREFLHEAYMLSGRTFYRGISRLMPGQILTYDPSNHRSTIAETSKAWAGLERSSLAETWGRITAAVSQSMGMRSRTAVMMSAGWDSRTLLAAALSRLPSQNILAYCHGRKDCLEVRLAREICDSLAITFHNEPLRLTTTDLELLKVGFTRTETVLFPEWHRAGQFLSSLGIDTVSSGVLGEMVGGHYSRTMLYGGAQKLVSFVMQTIGQNGSLNRILNALTFKDLVKPWYVHPEVWGNIDELRTTMNEDIKATFKRYINRGIESADQLVEAFITEHRGSQYIVSQMLSCRAYIDVSIPFAERDVFLQASRIPISAKFHNALNRRLLRRHNPKILRFRTAAAPVPASLPILVQEFSRLLRHFAERSNHMSTIAWYDWDFLRNDTVLYSIVDDLKMDLWKKERIYEKIANLRINHAEPVGTLLQRLLVIYTADLMMRN
jgi:hypothetical protein